jgi:hypothetical protein
MPPLFDPDRMFQEFRWKTFLQSFGKDFYEHLHEHGSGMFLPKPGQPSIAFQDQGHDFTLSLLPDSNWQLAIKHNGEDFITNIVESTEGIQAGDLVLTFHALKAEMIVELGLYIKQTEGRFEDKLREQRNKDVDIVPQQTKLPNTSIDLAEWECQLILNFVASGCNPKEAIKNAKQLVTLQLIAPGGNPGDLSYFDKCKPSVDQK